MCGFVGFVGEAENREQILTDMMNTIITLGQSGMIRTH